MSEKFEREERYIVFKVKDLSEHKLVWVRDVIRLNDIPTVDAVVVEADWPEYELTWAAIERRVSGRVHWDGQGLPPVGVTCIVSPHNTQWGFIALGDYECTVVGRHGDYVWLDMITQEPHAIGNKLRTTRWDKVDFSPVRTPEQIAAREREQDIERLAYEIAGYMDFDDPRDADIRLAEYLHDQNFRKQVAA